MRRDNRLISRILGILLLVGIALGIAQGGLSNSAVPAQASAKLNSASSDTSRPKVYVLRVYYKNNAERDELATEFGAAEVSTKDGYLTFWTDQVAYSKLLSRGLRVEVDEQATELANKPGLFGQDSPDGFFGGYRTVEDMQSYLNQYATNYPTLAQVVDIGDTWCKGHPGTCTEPAPNNGYDLLVLHITNQAIPGPKPVFWYESGIHAREIATPEMSMRFIAWLLDGYNTNPDAHWLVDYQDIWVLPMVNPDGHHIVESGGGGSSPYYQRKNGNDTNGCGVWPPSAFEQFGTDNNRNFSFKWDCCGGSSSGSCDQTYHGTGPASDPETLAIENQMRLLHPRPARSER